jgi:hypothetical protein
MGKFTTTIDVSAKERDVLRNALRWQAEAVEGLQAALEDGNPHGLDPKVSDGVVGVLELGAAFGWPLEADAEVFTVPLNTATIAILESMRSLEVQNIAEDEMHESSKGIVAACDQILNRAEAALVLMQAEGRTLAEITAEAA